jgi:hypothetical protein
MKGTNPCPSPSPFCPRLPMVSMQVGHLCGPASHQAAGLARVRGAAGGGGQMPVCITVRVVAGTCGRHPSMYRHGWTPVGITVRHGGCAWRGVGRLRPSGPSFGLSSSALKRLGSEAPRADQGAHAKTGDFSDNSIALRPQATVGWCFAGFARHLCD